MLLYHHACDLGTMSFEQLLRTRSTITTPLLLHTHNEQFSTHNKVRFFMHRNKKMLVKRTNIQNSRGRMGKCNGEVRSH